MEGICLTLIRYAIMHVLNGDGVIVEIYEASGNKMLY